MADVSGLVKNDALYRCRSNVSSLSNLPRYSLALLGLGQRRLRRLASGQKQVRYKSQLYEGYVDLCFYAYVCLFIWSFGHLVIRSTYL